MRQLLVGLCFLTASTVAAELTSGASAVAAGTILVMLAVCAIPFVERSAGNTAIRRTPRTRR
jgi:hypothetical protein